MNGLRDIPAEFSVEDIDRELIARGAQIPEEERFNFKDEEGTPERDDIMRRVKTLYDKAPEPNPALSHIDTQDLFKMLVLKTQKLGNSKGIWFTDNRVDYYEITVEEVKRNADSVAAVCTKDDLLESKKNVSKLKVKNYGKTFNLCPSEPFHDQCIAAGRLCTGFLVNEDTIATAGHFVNEMNVRQFRFVFGFKMEDYCTPPTQIPHKDIYEGVNVLNDYNRKAMETDWTLVKLDRKVEGRSPVKLSKKRIHCDQRIYVLGHPCGLPLKYAPGAKIWDVDETCFGAGLDLFMGNSGSPVFDQETHEVIGMVLRGDNRDLRCTGKCWVSVIYEKRDEKNPGPRCGRVSLYEEAVKMF